MTMETGVSSEVEAGSASALSKGLARMQETGGEILTNIPPEAFYVAGAAALTFLAYKWWEKRHEDRLNK